jgi:hypothetical protein
VGVRAQGGDVQVPDFISAEINPTVSFSLGGEISRSVCEDGIKSRLFTSDMELSSQPQKVGNADMETMIGFAGWQVPPAPRSYPHPTLLHETHQCADLPGTDLTNPDSEIATGLRIFHHTITVQETFQKSKADGKIGFLYALGDSLLVIGQTGQSHEE